MKTLLVFTDTDTSQVNGVQMTLYNLQKYLLPDWCIEIISPIHFLKFSLPTYREVQVSFAFPSKIRQFIQRVQPDAIHIATEGPIGFVAAMVCHKMNISYTSSFHTKFPDYIHMRSKFIPKKQVHRVLQFIHNSSSKVFVSNAYMKGYLEEHKYSSAIQIIPFGIDQQLFCPGKKRYFYDLETPILLYVGRLAMEKNLEAFLEIKSIGSKIVVGEGPLRKKLTKKYASSNVHFLGYRTGQELVDIFRSADVFVFPSLSDTLGLVNLEALACGIPVLAYNDGGITSVVQDGENGVLVPKGEKLDIGISQVLKIDSQNCRKSIEKYSWESYVSEFLNSQVIIENGVGSLQSVTYSLPLLKEKKKMKK